MFRPHPVFLLIRPGSFGTATLISAMTLWVGWSGAQSVPSSWDNARGGASILVTDHLGAAEAHPVRLVSGCSDDGCYAAENYWQSFCAPRPRGSRCRTGGCGLGICAGLACGDRGCCGSGCGVLGGCVTVGDLGCSGGGRPCGQGRQHAMLSSGLFGKLCGKGRGASPDCSGCGDGCGNGCGMGGGCGAGGDGTFCGLPAPAYPVPLRTPAYVGYHQFTYPPMMPHNSLPHYRNVYSFRHGPGLERTTVNWQPSYIKNALRQIHHVFYLPR